MSDTVDQFDHLVTHLNYRWTLHKDLFQGSQQYDLFNQSGSRIWLAFSDSLLDSIFMDVSRLLDPVKSCGKENLSIARVLKDARPNEYGHILGSNYDEATDLYARLIKPWRNKRLSHNDLSTLTANSELPEVPYADVELLVNKINEIARYVSLAEDDVDRHFPPSVTPSAWTPRLFRVLRGGIEALPDSIKKK